MARLPGRRRTTVFALALCLSLFHQPNSAEAYNDDNDNAQDCPTPLSTCENSVIRTTNVEWYCNSPYAYYWGGGAHRNSKVCAHNDKVTFQVTFEVEDDIFEVNDVYMALAVQDSGSQNILKTKRPSYLCNNYVGAACTSSGEYQFSVTIKLGASSASSSSNSGNGGSSSNGNSDDFCPMLILAFSTEPDNGYNLGALNMICQAWNNEFTVWAQDQKSTPQDWIRNYGMIVGTCVCLAAFAAFLWQQARRVTPFGACVDPCMMEMDQYYKCPHPGDSYLNSTSNPIPPTISAQNLDASNHSGALPSHQQTPKRPLYHG